MTRPFTFPVGKDVKQTAVHDGVEGASKPIRFEGISFEGPGRYATFLWLLHGFADTFRGRVYTPDLMTAARQRRGVLFGAATGIQNAPEILLLPGRRFWNWVFLCPMGDATVREVEKVLFEVHHRSLVDDFSWIGAEHQPQDGMLGLLPSMASNICTRKYCVALC